LPLLATEVPASHVVGRGIPQGPGAVGTEGSSLEGGGTLRGCRFGFRLASICLLELSWGRLTSLAAHICVESPWSNDAAKGVRTAPTTACGCAGGAGGRGEGPAAAGMDFAFGEVLRKELGGLGRAGEADSACSGEEEGGDGDHCDGLGCDDGWKQNWESDDVVV